MIRPHRQWPGLAAVACSGAFGDSGFIFTLALAPKVQPVISPVATPWETHPPTQDQSSEWARPDRVLPFQGEGSDRGRCHQGVARRCPSLTSSGAFGAEAAHCFTSASTLAIGEKRSAKTTNPLNRPWHDFAGEWPCILQPVYNKIPRSTAKTHTRGVRRMA